MEQKGGKSGMCICGQPLFGTRYRHLPGCPSAPEKSEVWVCRCCGHKFEEESWLTNGICRDCLEGAFTVSLGLWFVQQNLTDFFEWEDQISYRHHPARQQIDALLLERLRGQLASALDCVRRQAADALREYCFGEWERWADFAGQHIFPG